MDCTTTTLDDKVVGLDDDDPALGDEVATLETGRWLRRGRFLDDDVVGIDDEVAAVDDEAVVLDDDDAALATVDSSHCGP